MAKYTPVKTNFVYPEIKDTDYRFGSFQLIGTPLREDGDWRDYLPPEEDQNVRGVESSACYIEGQQHAVATLEEEVFGEKDNNYSARFNALLSNGTPNGGDPLKGAYSMHKDGLVKQQSMPWDGVTSWDDFHSWKGVNEKDLINEGKTYLTKKTINYDIVFERWESVENKYTKLKQALKYSPVPVSVDAWYEENGEYVKLNKQDNHLVLAVYVDDKNRIYVRDTYSPYLKILKANYNCDFAMRWSVQKKSPTEQKASLISWMLDLSKQALALMLKLLPILKSEQPVSEATPKLKYLWDTPDVARHSVRLLCDEMGLTVAEKNLICQVINCESGFHQYAKNENKYDGKVTSTDWGICQINDYWHIGKEKTFPSAQYVLDNPEACVRWMIKMFKTGRLNLWVCFSGNYYKNYKA